MILNLLNFGHGSTVSFYIHTDVEIGILLVVQVATEMFNT